MEMISFEEAYKKGMEFIIWGAGQYLQSIQSWISNKLIISCIIDTDKSKQGRCYTSRELRCVGLESVINKKNIFILVCVRDRQKCNAIMSLLNEYNIPNVHIITALDYFQTEIENEQIVRYKIRFDDVPEPDDKEILKFFLSISIPVDACNLSCSYCYISQTEGFQRQAYLYHSPKFIRLALSRKRLGGTSLINLCGNGETLIDKSIIPIIREFLVEGHYVSIITNATLTDRIKELLDECEGMNDRIFFKCSFHYKQMIEKGFMNSYLASIELIKKSAASYTIEMVPSDDLIEYIDDIKSFSINYFGALPHLTIPRNESLSDIPLLSSLSEHEFYNTWKDFKSAMFDFKMSNKRKITEFCLAGRNALLFSLDTGVASPCPYNYGDTNLYDDISSNISTLPIGHNCQAPWCVNGHAYLALGLVRGIDVSYLDMRDRVTSEGEHWVKPTFRKLFSQKIYEAIG